MTRQEILKKIEDLMAQLASPDLQDEPREDFDAIDGHATIQGIMVASYVRTPGIGDFS